jgi:hypothetical protein
MKKYYLLVMVILTGMLGYAQNTITQQNFDGGATDCWNYTGGNLDASHRYNGTNSARVGRSGETTTLSFNSVSVAGYANVVLSFRHSVRGGTGPGMDTREGAVFQVRLNGGAWTNIDEVAGFGDHSYGFTATGGSATASSGCNVYQAPNPLVYNVPAGINSVEFRVVSVYANSTTCATFNTRMTSATAGNFDRTDEGIHIDAVTLTATSTITGPAAPGAITGGGTFCSGPRDFTRSTPATGITYYWQTTAAGTSTANSAATYSAASTTTIYLRARDNCSGLWSTAVSETITINPEPAATAGSNAIMCGTGHTLAGSTPLAGQSGIWTVQSKPSGATDPVFANATLNNSGVSFTERGTYTLRWTMSTFGAVGDCTPEHSDVSVTYLTGTGSTWTGLAATVGGDGEDWTDCRNWAEGAVPTTGAQVLLGDTRGAEFGGGSITTLPQNIPTLSLDRLQLNTGLSGGARLANNAVLTLTSHLILEHGKLSTTGSGFVYVTNPSATQGIVRNTALESHDYTNTNAHLLGTLRRSVNSTDTYRFPVGDGSYRLAEVTPTALPAPGDYVESTFQSSVLPSGWDAFLPYADHNAQFSEALQDGSWRIESNMGAPEYTIELYPSAASLAFCGGMPCAAYTLAKKSGGTWANGSSQPLFYGANGQGEFNGLSVRNSVGRSGYASFSEFIIVGSPDELFPLAQLQLHGQWQGKHTQLHWQTTEEDGVRLFDLQRSATGQSFGTVAEVPAQGYTQGQTHYETLDTQPLPEAFYRVRAVDADGGYTYSNVVYLAAAPNLAAASGLSVYPNPNAGTALHIGYPAGSSQLRLHNALGQVVRNQDLTGHTSNVVWEVAALSAGVYTLSATAPSGTYTQKVVINSYR